jgi:lipoate-protein ligase A
MLHYLDYTAATPAENLAVDEVLLDWVEESVEEDPIEVLRVWQPTSPFLVIGRASILRDEANEEACRAKKIPILRRSSGGTAIVTGPGCLMYAVVLSLRKRPELRMIDAAHRFVLQHLAKAVSSCGIDAQCAGTSDVVVGGKKCSGNSLRTRRESLLYHGTVLLDFDLTLMDCLSTEPPRQPEYRQGRTHAEFVENLRLNAEQVKAALRQTWQAREVLSTWPERQVAALAASRFSDADWTNQR